MSALACGDSAEISIPKKSRLNCIEKPDLQESIHSNLKNLSGFKVIDILSNNTNRKSISLRGTFDSKEGEAVVLLEKTGFVEDDLKIKKEYFTENNLLEKILQNDIYGDYKYFPHQELSVIKTTVIHPASEKHIIKYSTQKCYIVDETPAIYKDVILPHLATEQLHLQWVYNILEHKCESERIVFEDPDPINGFILLPDLKWSGTVDTLYLLAIVNRRDIKSLRDLREEHLPLLKNIRVKGSEAIKSKYSLDSSRLRIYFHYQPSFYHLHVHLCYLQHEAPGILAEKAHLLSQVISNIELLPDYYQKATIPFVVKENHTFFKTLEEKDILTRS